MNDVLFHLIACDLWYLVFETCVCALIYFLVLGMLTHSLLKSECLNEI